MKQYTKEQLETLTKKELINIILDSWKNNKEFEYASTIDITIADANQGRRRG